MKFNSHRNRIHKNRLRIVENLEPRIVLDSTVVFNEVMYNPLGGEDSGTEWIELYNQLAIDMDISEWVLDGGVKFTFPDKTIVPGRGHIVIAADPAALEGVAGSAVLGPFEGRLSNAGERLVLYNNDDRRMNVVDYGDNGDWPVGPDGGGVSLSKGNQLGGSHLSENWTISESVGGTPGIDNFVEPGTFVFRDLIGLEAPVSAIVPDDGSLGLDWVDPAFDDSGWLKGTTGVGHESSRAATYDRFLGLDLDEPPEGQTADPLEDVNGSVYMRIPFEFDPNEPIDKLQLGMRFDDGFALYLNGTLVLTDRAPENLEWNSIATSSHRDALATSFEQFDLTEHLGLLQSGQNIMAIHGMNRSATDSDSLFYPILSAGTEILPVETIDLRFNEVGAASDENFYVELANTGDTPINLEGMILSKQGEQNEEYVFPAQTLNAGELLSITKSDLGFTPADNDFLGVYSADRVQLLDAKRITNSLRGVSEEHDGRWLYPSTPTPGASNEFAINDDVVINEIMYHAAPTLAIPDVLPTYSNNEILPFDATWRYNDTGSNYEPGWEDQVYAVDNETWKEGPGTFGRETRELPRPIQTPFGVPRDNDPQFRTYYFQTEFEATDEVLNADILNISHQIDDGAIFYLNGTEVLRYNLPSGVIEPDFRPNRVEASVEGPFGIETSHLVAGTNVLSVEVYNRTLTDSDIVFGASLSWGEQLTDLIPGSPYSDSTEEWIELHNKGQEAVDLTGWKFDDGIGFDFADGLMLGAGEYLVVASDVEDMAARYPGINVVGPFSGTLSNRDDNIQLFDANKNLADEVHYYEGGQWDSVADGGNSSLQLSDPNADNSSGRVWAASDESEKSEWVDYSFRGISEIDVTNRRPVFNEFIFGLLDSGQFLIDDIEVTENPSSDTPLKLIQNGTFEEDALGESPDKWRVIGNHIGTVIVDPTNPDNKVLHINAEGAQGHIHDHAETTFIDDYDFSDGTEYEFTFRAKWLSGNSQLHSRLFFNRLANTLRLDKPLNVGTPGTQNSNFVENSAPTYEDLQQSPATPEPGEEVSVQINIVDSDGIQSAKVFYHEDGEAWSSVDMSAAAGSSLYTASIPGFERGDIIQFYVEATDNAGLKSTFPEEGADSHALYQVEDGRGPRSDIDRIRLVMREADERELFLNTNRMSNRYIGATLVHNNTIYHDIDVRQVGSRWIRPNSGYKVVFNTEKAFNDVHDSVRLDLNGMAEIVMKQMVNRAGIGQNSMYDDIAYLVSPNGSHTHEILLNLARYENIYLDEQFGDSSGTKFELDDVTWPTAPNPRPEGLKTNTEVNTGADIGVNGATVSRQGDNPEFYRAHLLIKNNRAKDDFASIARLAQAIHNKTGDDLFAASNEVMDVDKWMRHYANQAYLGNWDTYGFGRPKNLRMYVRPDGKFVPLFWDCDLCNFSEPIVRRTEATSRLDEIRDIPHNLRLYWGHLHHYMEKSFNEEYVAVWASHYGEKANNATHGGDENFNGIIASTRARTSSVTNSLESAIPPVEFEITTNGGEATTVDTANITLEGKGWVNVRTIRLEGIDEPLDAYWPETDVWQIELPLAAGENQLKLQAFNFDGELIASDEISVTTTAENSVADSLRISEVHYNPADANQAESELGFDDGNDFEFIELVNRGTQTISLVDVSLVRVEIDGNNEGVDFNFADGAITELQPGARVVVTEDADAFAARYGDQVPVAGQWSGGLSNGSETLTLQVNGLTSQQFAYDDEWHPSTDGEGASLEVVDINADLSAWSTAEGWRPSINGSPGGDAVVVGDSNGDGVFNSSDLVLVNQAGEYEDGIDGNSTFAEGDWNGDGDFDTADLVFAFIFGDYSSAAVRDTVEKSDVPLLEGQSNLKRMNRLIAAQDVDSLFADADRDTDLISDRDELDELLA